MKRLSALIWLCVIVAAALLLYMVKYEVQSLRSQIASKTRELDDERESLRAARAEWAYLNRPARLAGLATKYLSATGMTSDQVAEIEAIPFPDQKQKTDAEEGLPTSPVSYRKPAGGER